MFGGVAGWLHQILTVIHIDNNNNQ